MRGVTKTFGPVIANDKVDLDIRQGEILALLGENGSGKTTLMNMLAGIYYPDEGHIAVRGKAVTIRSPKDAFDLGIGMIHQHFKLVDVLTAAENIVLGLKEPGRLDLKVVGGRVREICERYGFAVDPEQKIYNMSVSQKQTVEIVKVLYRGADILILDEPTAVLTPQETDRLFDVLRNMRADGKSIVIITHKLHEVMAISDRVAVLRKGQYVGDVPTSQTDPQKLTEMMMGRSVTLNIDRPLVEHRPLRLEVRDLTVRSDDGVLALDHVSFQAMGGEILGVAGISGSGQKELLEAIEIPLSFVLAQMEHIGFYVDKESIQAYGKELEAQVNQLHDEIIQEVGYEFNINSPKQLGEALFGKLGLPHGKKTKSGWSTNADVLEELRLLHPVVDKVLRYRTVAKLKSTYCDGLLKVIGPDGRVHSTFNQTETRTGRISSAEPNLQNIPVRTPIGRELRKFFAGSDGNLLVDADYSQIELRVLAHVADDAAMKEDFLEGRDIHTATAARVFQMPVDMVTKDMRSKAKAVNFGIVYGIGAFSLSKDIGVTRKEADDYIKEYLRNYAGVDAYMKRVVEEAKEKGYVETLFGRRRYLPELKSGNFNLRAFGERVARNMPIQGAAADIIKIAMIRVSDRLAREGLQGRLILQVHDELIVECPPEEREQVERILQEEMEGAVSLSVPMVAEAGSGRTWFEAKE